VCNVYMAEYLDVLIYIRYHGAPYCFFVCLHMRWRLRLTYWTTTRACAATVVPSGTQTWPCSGRRGQSCSLLPSEAAVEYTA
jgi:hypothetical protein